MQLRLLLILLILNLSNLSYSQLKWNYTRTLSGFGIGLIGGVANGYNETLTHHYNRFKKVHPNANDNFWDPKLSWKRKYANWDNGDYREAYFGSKTFLVWTTDPYHFSSTLSNTAMVGGTFVITFGEKREWWEYVIDFTSMFIGRSIGFHTIYSVIYK